MKFKYFENINNPNDTTDNVEIYISCLGMGFDHIADEMIKVSIDDQGGIGFEVLDPYEYLTDENKNDILEVLEKINWDNGYEFVDFIDENTKKEYALIGEEPSDVYKMVVCISTEFG